jgi:hypothetical protein
MSTFSKLKKKISMASTLKVRTADVAHLKKSLCDNKLPLLITTEKIEKVIFM